MNIEVSKICETNYNFPVKNLSKFRKPNYNVSDSEKASIKQWGRCWYRRSLGRWIHAVTMIGLRVPIPSTQPSTFQRGNLAQEH